VAERAQRAAQGGGGADGFGEGGVLQHEGELGGVAGGDVGQEGVQPGAGAREALGGFLARAGCAARGGAAGPAAVGAGVQAREDGGDVGGDGAQAALDEGDQPRRQHRRPRRDGGEESVEDGRQVV
jgi:hypothetical protein